MFLMNQKVHYYLKYLEPPVVLFDQMFLMNLNYLMSQMFLKNLSYR
jgi:hypothetical protein